jgi:hypothetical protein
MEIEIMRDILNSIRMLKYERHVTSYKLGIEEFQPIAGSNYCVSSFGVIRHNKTGNTLKALLPKNI